MRRNMIGRYLALVFWLNNSRAAARIRSRVFILLLHFLLFINVYYIRQPLPTDMKNRVLAIDRLEQ